MDGYVKVLDDQDKRAADMMHDHIYGAGTRLHRDGNAHPETYAELR